MRVKLIRIRTESGTLIAQFIGREAAYILTLLDNMCGIDEVQKSKKSTADILYELNHDLAINLMNNSNAKLYLWDKTIIAVEYYKGWC